MLSGNRLAWHVILLRSFVDSHTTRVPICCMLLSIIKPRRSYIKLGQLSVQPNLSNTTVGGIVNLNSLLKSSNLSDFMVLFNVGSS